MKFTEANIQQIKVPEDEREITVIDDSLPGFGIRAFSTGRASYFVKYSIGPQQRKITLGAVIPGVLADMRRKASDVLARAGLGQDVSAERKKARARRIVLFKDLIKQYLADKRDSWRPSTYDAFKRHFEQHWACFHSWEVQDITRREVVRAIDEMAQARGVVTADRAKATLSGFFGWTIEKDYVESNPTRDIASRAKPSRTKRVLSEAELVAIWREAAGGEYATILRLLILTGQRKNEVGGLRWPEIDFERQQINLPAERAKNHRPHIIPLSEPAMLLLCEVPKREGRELLFGKGEGSFSGWSKHKLALDGRLPKKMAPWVVHDIRRSVATHMAEHGFAEPHVIEAVLNHVSGQKASVAGVYNRAVYAAEKRRALDTWAAHLLELLQKTMQQGAAPAMRQGLSGESQLAARTSV